MKVKKKTKPTAAIITYPVTTITQTTISNTQKYKIYDSPEFYIVNISTTVTGPQEVM